MSKLYCYESLTSDLKVWTERSPLSEWTDTNIVKKLRFQIIFNRNQTKSPVIRGNQTQLESLITGIASYVDRLLNSSSSNQDFEFQLFHQVDIPNLGKFSRLEFSTLELFDLFTNLELLTSEIEILPVLVPNINPINPLWLKVAAAAIATVGITTGTFKLLQPDSPQYVVTSNSIANSTDSNSEQKSIKSNNLAKSQPQIKNSKSLTRSLEKDKSQVQTSIPTDSLIQTPKKSIQLPQTPPTITSSPTAKKPNISVPLAIPNSAIAPTPKISNPIPQSSIADSSKVDLSKVETPKTAPTPTAPAITTNSAGANATQEIPETDLKNTGKVTIKTPPETPLVTLESPQALGQARATERRDVDRFRARVSKNQNSQDQNLKLTVIKIDGSVNPQDLEAYKNKIESFSLSSTKLAILINTEIKITVRWQNRQIVETKIIPESSELNEFIRRSLFETFPDQDGNIGITLKVTAP